MHLGFRALGFRIQSFATSWAGKVLVVEFNYLAHLVTGKYPPKAFQLIRSTCDQDLKPES